MAELIYRKNNLKFYATPKCGITLAEFIFKKNLSQYAGGIDYNLILVRNPMYRLVSFYLQKLVNFRSCLYYNNMFSGLESSKFNDSNGGFFIGEYSFSKFVDLIIQIEDNELERHLRPQYIGVENIKFDRVLRLEDIDKDFKLVVDDLSLENYEKLPHLNDARKQEIFSVDGAIYKNPHPTNSNITTESFDLTPSELKENGIPSNYNLFLSESIKDKIFKKFEKDFKLFNYNIV